MRRVSVLLALSLLVAFSAGAGENSCHLELSFIDALTLTPIEGVHVRLANRESALRRDLPSTSDGRVLAFDLESGTWEAESEPEGYEWFSLTGLRCVPGGFIHLEIRLKPTDADEGLSLGDAPEINGTSTRAEVFFKLPDTGLPREGTPRWIRDASDVPSHFQPRAFEAHDLLVPESGALIPLHTWPRKAPGAGRFELGLGTGAAGKLVRSRGVSRRQTLQMPLLFDWVFPLSHEKRLSVFAGAGIRFLDSRNGLADDWRGPSTRDRDRSESARLAFDLESSSARRFAFDVQGAFGAGNRSDSAATMYALGTIPHFDSRRQSTDAGSQLRWMVDERMMVYGELEYSLRNWDLEPAKGGPLLQDFTPDGSFSSGFGRGVFGGGTSGFPELHDREETLDASFGLVYSASPRDMLSFALKYERNAREFCPKGAAQASDSGRWRQWSNSMRSFDLLLPAEGKRGVSSRLGISLSDIRRLSSSVTLRLGLEMEERDFDAGQGRPGVHFDFDQTLSPEVALIWDFVGGGKSRAWLSWSRKRPRLGEMVRLRLAGSLVSVGGVASQDPLPDPASLEVDPDLAPPRLDLFSVGLEREVFAHFRFGAAVSVERFRHGIAILQGINPVESLLAAPTPESVWGDALERDTTRASLWLRKSPSSGWQALMHFGWIGQSGTWEGDPDLDLTNPDLEFSSDILSPGSLMNARGRLDGDRRFFIDCMASWYSTSGLSIGSRFFWRMGAPLSLRGALDPGYGLEGRFVEPRGSAGRGPSTGQLDFNLMAPLGRRAPNLRVEVFNCLFFQKPEKIDQRWSLLDPVQAQGLTPEEQFTPGFFGKVLRYQNPPEVRVSLQWHW